jgi:hypothetical protein
MTVSFKTLCGLIPALILLLAPIAPAGAGPLVFDAYTLEFTALNSMDQNSCQSGHRHATGDIAAFYRAMKLQSCRRHSKANGCDAKRDAAPENEKIYYLNCDNPSTFEDMVAGCADGTWASVKFLGLLGALFPTPLALMATYGSLSDEAACNQNPEKKDKMIDDIKVFLSEQARKNLRENLSCTQLLVHVDQVVQNRKNLLGKKLIEQKKYESYLAAAGQDEKAIARVERLFPAVNRELTPEEKEFKPKLEAREEAQITLGKIVQTVRDRNACSSNAYLTKVSCEILGTIGGGAGAVAAKKALTASGLDKKILDHVLKKLGLDLNPGPWRPVRTPPPLE